MTLLQAALDGFAYSGLYAMLGLAFLVMFSVLRRLDLSFGTVVMASVYVSAMAAGKWNAPFLTPLLALPLCIAGGLLVACVSFRLVRGDPRYSLASTLGVWMVVEELVVQGPGYGQGQSVSAPVTDSLLAFSDLTLRVDHLAVLAMSIAVAFGLHAVLVRTRVGLAIRAMAYDASVASLLGMSPARVGMMATVLASSVGCVAGWTFAASQQAIDVHFGMWATTKGLVILVVGGQRRIGLVLAAALALGVGERVCTELLGAASRELVGLTLVALALAVVPRGLGVGTVEAR